MKKRILSILLAVLLIVGLMPISVFANATAPVGITADTSWYNAQDTTFSIDSIAQLAGLGLITQGSATGIDKDSFTGKTVQLAANLTFAAGEYWYYNDGTTVYDYRLADFAGTLDGQGNTVTGLNFLHTAGTNVNVGLCSKLAASGAVNNLNIDTVTGTFGAEVRYGTIAATLDGSVDKCNLKNINITVSEGVCRAGALGYSVGNTGNTTVSDCTLDGFTVKNTAPNAAGVCTYVALLGTVKAGTTVTGCDVQNVTVEASGELQNVGGLIGLAKTTAISDCTVSTVTLISGNQVSFTGGFAGQLQVSTVERCTATNITISGAILKRPSGNGEDGTGGFIGTVKDGCKVDQCSVSVVKLTATEQANQLGGFLGSVDNSANTVSNCTADQVEITIADEATSLGSGNCVGGFVGQSRIGGGSFDNCNVTNLTITVTGNGVANIGGFIGNMGADTTITNSSADGTIDTAAASQGEEFLVGGFASNLGWGQACNIQFEECAADVDVTAKGVAGGFLGAAQDLGDGSSLASVTISNSTATGDVVSTEGVAGGFVGTGNRGDYDNCEASGSVSGDVAGGFFGTITPNTSSADSDDKTVTITNSDATGIVLGATAASGFAGTVTTADDQGENLTTVTIESSSAASLVAGATANTVVTTFANDTTADSGNSGYTEAGNTEAGKSMTVVSDTTTLTMQNGAIVVPAGTTVQVDDEKPVTVTITATVTSAQNTPKQPTIPIIYRNECFATTTGEFKDVAYFGTEAKAGDVVTLKVSLSDLGEQYGLDYKKITVVYETEGMVQLGATYDYNNDPVYKDGMATDFILSEGLNSAVAHIYYNGFDAGICDIFYAYVN